MNEEEYNEYLETMLARAQAFATSHDTAANTLSLEDSTQYASMCVSFLESFSKLKLVSQNRRIASIYLATLVARWKALTDFVTCCSATKPKTKARR